MKRFVQDKTVNQQINLIYTLIKQSKSHEEISQILNKNSIPNLGRESGEWVAGDVGKIEREYWLSDANQKTLPDAESVNKPKAKPVSRVKPVVHKRNTNAWNVVNMVVIIAIFILLFLAFNGSRNKSVVIAGSMDERSICATAGLIIKQIRGSNVKTSSESCSVINIGSNNVEIESGYLTPINPKSLRYTARGFVRGTTLTIKEIRVHGVDDEFVPISEF